MDRLAKFKTQPEPMITSIVSEEPIIDIPQPVRVMEKYQLVNLERADESASKTQRLKQLRLAAEAENPNFRKELERKKTQRDAEKVVALEAEQRQERLDYERECAEDKERKRKSSCERTKKYLDKKREARKVEQPKVSKQPKPVELSNARTKVKVTKMKWPECGLAENDIRIINLRVIDDLSLKQIANRIGQSQQEAFEIYQAAALTIEQADSKFVGLAAMMSPPAQRKSFTRTTSDQLTAKQQQIIELRDVDDPTSFTEISRIMGVHNSKPAKLFERALKKLMVIDPDRYTRIKQRESEIAPSTRHDKVFQMYQQGVSVSEISNVMGLSEAQSYNIIRHQKRLNSDYTKPKKTKSNELTQKERRAFELRNSEPGITFKQMSERLSLPLATVQYQYNRAVAKLNEQAS